MNRTLKVAVIQLKVGTNKAENLTKATQNITNAVQKGAKLIILPECFNSPYGNNFFQKYSEAIPEGETIKKLSSISKELQVWIVGGSIPENSEKHYYNTCTIFDPTGNLVTNYRKMHLFDIDIPGKIVFKESQTLSAGNQFANFVIDKFKIGLGICYDLRFPEFSSILTSKGCNVLIFPGAFNTITGPMHWHLLLRARAVDNQCYLVGASPARNDGSGYNPYGHSLIVDPRGEIISEAGEGEEIIFADFSLDTIEESRNYIPSLKQKRTDIYNIPTLLK